MFAVSQAAEEVTQVNNSQGEGEERLRKKKRKKKRRLTESEGGK